MSQPDREHSFDTTGGTVQRVRPVRPPWHGYALRLLALVAVLTFLLAGLAIFPQHVAIVTSIAGFTLGWLAAKS